MRVGRHTIREVGDPVLRRVAKPVEDARDLGADGERLKAALAAFRTEFGFGRAIAAPQIGISRRLLAVDLGAGPFLVTNPEITSRSKSTFTMFDDCMSFPSLLVRVRRHDSLTLRYLDERGRRRSMVRLDRSRSELFQHEVDHLDGVLALDRALPGKSVVARGEYERQRGRFDAGVDYTIPAPAAGSSRPTAERRARPRRGR